MNYAKIILSAIAAILLAEFVPGPWSVFKGVSSEKATGLAALVGGMLSPLFWLLAILLFAMFFYASRLGSKVLRILLFWTPTLLLSSVGILFVAFVVYAFLHSFTTSVAGAILGPRYPPHCLSPHPKRNSPKQEDVL